TDDVTLLPEQSAHLLLIGAAVSQQALGQHRQGRPSAENERAGLDLLNLAVVRDLKLPAEMHELRLELLALSPDPSADSLTGAFDLASRQVPDLGLALNLQTATILAQTSIATWRGASS